MYVYAFLKTPEGSLSLPQGITGSIQLICSADVSALAEPELPWEAIQDNDDRLIQAVLAHDRVLRELFQQTPLLPLRFGTRFLSVDSLLEHLKTHREEYQQKLGQIAGKAEYVLKAIPLDVQPEPTLPADVQGRDYFLAKKRRYQSQVDQQQQQLAQWQTVVDAIAQLYPNLVLGEAKNNTQSLYLLVNRLDEFALYQQLKTWQNQCASWQLNLSEALPPYHFV